MKKIITLLTMLLFCISVNSQTSQPTNTGITGSGTVDYIPKFIGAKKIANSPLFSYNSGVMVGANVAVGAFNANLINNHGFFVNRTGADDFYGAFCIGDGGSWTFRINKNGALQSTNTSVNNFILGTTSIGTASVNAYLTINGSYGGYALYSSGGKWNVSNLPTSSSGLVTGDIWNDSGTLKIVP